MDIVRGSLTLYMVQSVQSEALINIVPQLECMGSDSFLVGKSIKYEWQIESSNGSLLKIGFRNSNRTLTLQNQRGVSIATNYTQRLIARMFYINTLIRDTPVSVEQAFDLKITSDPIVMIFQTDTGYSSSNNSFVFSNRNPNVVLNASLSTVIHPSYLNNQVRFYADCPKTLFKTSEDFKKWCFMDFRGILTIPLSSLNVIPFQLYNLTVTGTIRNQEQINVTQLVFFSYAPLTPIGVECPLIKFPTFYNISKYELNVKRSTVQIFPSVLNLVCQRLGGYVASYSVSKVTWDDEDNIITFDQGSKIYGQVKSSEEINRVSPGDTKIIKVMYSLESQEASVNVRAGTELRIIKSDFELQIAGLKSYAFDESITINITGTYDPEDPGTSLVYNWICPSWVLQKKLCPSNANPFLLRLTQEQKIALLWRNGRNNTLWLQIQNPRSNKQQLLNLTIFLEPIPLTQGIGLCPSYDFSGAAQSLKKNFSDDTFYMILTNDYSDIFISQPSLKNNCQRPAQILGMHFMEENDTQPLLLNSPPLMQVLNQGIKLDGNRLSQLEYDREYKIGVYMYYRLNSSPDIKVYMKYIKVVRVQTEDALIAKFKEDQIVVKANSNAIVIIDASLSRDSGNSSYTNYSYNWECSQNFPQNLCPNNSALIQLTKILRNTLNIDLPGSFYTFRLQLLDAQNNRTSQWTSSSLFFAPSESSDCLSTPQTNFSLRFSSPLLYPHLTAFPLAALCTNLSITNFDTFIQSKINDTAIGAVKAITDSKSLLVQALTPNLTQSMTATHRVSYQVNDNYRQVLEIKSDINYQLQKQSGANKVKVKGPSVANLQEVISIVMDTESQQNQQIVWRCDGRLGIDAKCAANRASQIRITREDIRQQIYLQTVNRGETIRFDILENNNQIGSHFIFFTNQNKQVLLQYQNCQIRHSQEEDQIDIFEPTLLTLYCEGQDVPFFSVNWTLTNSKTLQFIKLPSLKGRSSIIPKYSLDLNELYYINATLRLNKSSGEHLKFTVALSTQSQLPSSISKNSGSPSLQLIESPSNMTFGYFYQSLFKILLPNYTTSIDTLTLQPLTLYFVVHYQDIQTADKWFFLQPLQPQTMYNQSLVRVPRFSRMRVVIVNTYGVKEVREVVAPDIYFNATFRREDINELAEDAGIVEVLNEIEVGIDIGGIKVLRKIKQVNEDIIRQHEMFDQDDITILGWWGDRTPLAQMMAKSAQLFTKAIQNRQFTEKEVEISQEIIQQYFYDRVLAKLMFQQDLNDNLAYDLEEAFIQLNLTDLPFSLYLGYLYSLPPDFPLLFKRSNYQIILYRMLDSEDIQKSLSLSTTFIKFKLSKNNEYLIYQEQSYQSSQNYRMIGNFYTNITILDRNLDPIDRQIDFNITFTGIIGEEQENSTCAWFNGTQWNIDSFVVTVKVSSGSIQCNANRTRLIIGLVMLDKATGIPIVIQKPEEKRPVPPLVIENKTPQYNIVRVIFIVVSTMICFTFLFLQFLAWYATVQDLKYLQLKFSIASNNRGGPLKRLNEFPTQPSQTQTFQSLLFQLIRFNFQAMSLFSSFEHHPCILVRTQLLLTSVFVYCLISTVMVVCPGISERLSYSVIITLVLQWPLNKVREIINLRYAQKTKLCQKLEGTPTQVNVGRSKQGDSSRRLFSRGRINNTLMFTQEEEIKESNKYIKNQPFHNNDDMVASIVTESRFQSMEQAMGEKIAAQATIQLTRSPDFQRKAIEQAVGGLKLWQTSVRRRRNHKIDEEDLSQYNFKEIVNQERPPPPQKVIQKMFQVDYTNTEDVEFVSSLKEEGSRENPASPREFRLAYPFHVDTEREEEDTNNQISELYVNSRGVQETEVGASHPNIEPRQLLETTEIDHHMPTLVSPKNINLEFEQPVEKFSTLRSPLRTEMIIGNQLSRKLVFGDNRSDQTSEVDVKPVDQEVKFSTGSNQMRAINANEEAAQSFSSVLPLNPSQMITAFKPMQYESEPSKNDVVVNVMTTEFEDQQHVLKPPSLKYWLTHAFFINGGMLALILLLWDKNLSMTNYNEDKASQILRVFTSWLLISFSINILAVLLPSIPMALVLRRKEQPSGILKFLVFGGEAQFKIFQKEFIEGTKEMIKSDSKVTQEGVSQTDMESPRQFQKQTLKRQQRRRLKQIIKT